MLLSFCEIFFNARSFGMESWHLKKVNILSLPSCKIIFLLNIFNLNFVWVFDSKHFVSFCNTCWQFSFVIKYMILTDLSFSDAPPLKENTILLCLLYIVVWFTIDVYPWWCSCVTLGIVLWFRPYLINKVVFLVQYQYPHCDIFCCRLRKIPGASQIFMRSIDQWWPNTWSEYWRVQCKLRIAQKVACWAMTSLKKD